MQGAKNSRVLDPTKFLKITKVGASIRLVQGNKNAEVLSYCICPSRKDRYGVYRSKLVFWSHFKSPELVLCINKAQRKTPLSSE